MTNIHKQRGACEILQDAFNYLWVFGANGLFVFLACRIPKWQQQFHLVISALPLAQPEFSLRISLTCLSPYLPPQPPSRSAIQVLQPWRWCQLHQSVLAPWEGSNKRFPKLLRVTLQLLCMVSLCNSILCVKTSMGQRQSAARGRGWKKQAQIPICSGRAQDDLA